MKKKIITLCTVLVLALSAVVMTGCKMIYNVGTIKWVEKPATVYSLNDTTGLSFTIQAEIDNKTTTITYPTTEYNVTVKNFTTATVGTRTATVTYENLTLSFKYTVIDSKFAGGTGDEADPYKVSTAGQFQNMLNQKTFGYYVLTNTIDFSGYALKMANKGRDASSDEAWTGVIDGNGYSITGISKVLTADGQEINKYNEIFGTIGKANEKFVMKNLTVDFASTGASATMGLAFKNGADAQIEFENVKLTGYINAANSANSSIAPFINFINRDSYVLKSLTFKNCESDLKILNAYANNYVSGFAVSMVGATIPAGAIKFDNCKFNGLIEGSYDMGIGAFFTGNAGTKTEALSFTNCTIGENAQYVKTAGLGSDNAKYNCGQISLNGGKNDVQGITGTMTTGTSLNSIELTVDGLNVAANVEGAVRYEIYAVGTMDYANSKGGAFRFVQPADATNGALNYTLKKIKYNGENAPENSDTKYGTNLIVEENGVLVYYGKTVCESINVSKVNLVVVAYNVEGKAIAFAQYSTGLNLAA